MWMENPRMQTFVHDWEKVIAYSSVVAMLAFVIWGQGVAAKALFQHFVQGNYTIKRFNLQIVRFFGFGLQALHYGFGPLMTAKPFGWTDPIFLQGAIGTTGVSFVLVWAMIGMIRGRHARREHRGINRP